jgi:hypothetical protein
MGKYNPYAASAQRSSSNSFNKTLHFDKMKEQQPYTFFTTKKDGDYEITLVPYTIGKKHPAVKEGADVGDELYSFAYEAHKQVGPKKATVLCPLAMQGKPCPICEAAEEAKKKFGWSADEYKNLKAKRRVLYNVIDMMNPDKGIQIFDESDALFEQTLVKAAGAKGRRKGADFVPFGDGLHTILFTKGTKKIGTNDCAEYDSFDFEELDKAPKYPKDQKPFSFDEFMNIYSYEELQALFYGDSEEDDEEEEEVAEKKEKAVSKDEDDEKEEPKPRRSKKDEDEDEDEVKDKPKCPTGKRYGKDYDRDDTDCDDCADWKKCRLLTKEAK